MKPNTPNQSFFHPSDDVYVGSDALKENHAKPSGNKGVRESLFPIPCLDSLNRRETRRARIAIP